MADAMSVKDRLSHRSCAKLSRRDSLDVIDESHLHEGHAGHRPGGETHFRVHIVSPAFAGKSRIERHRMINARWPRNWPARVHALAIKAQAPGES